MLLVYRIQLFVILFIKNLIDSEFKFELYNKIQTKETNNSTQMTELFPVCGQQPIDKKSAVFQKKYEFQAQIRKNKKKQRIQYLREVHFGIGAHINSLVSALPSSFQDLQEYILDSPEYNKVISKLVVDRIYETQIKPDESAKEESLFLQHRSYILPEKSPDSNQQFQKWMYFFMVLIQNQGTYSPYIFKKYFPILKISAKKFHQTVLLFDLINAVVRQRNLNWVPINELISLVQEIQSSEQAAISQLEAEVYLNLSKFYYEAVRDTTILRKRIMRLLEEGSECFQRIKPKTFFKICLALTYHENAQRYFDEEQGAQKKMELHFHKSMLKGSIIKNLYKQIFYSSKQRLREICLNVLGNLIIQLESSFIWMEEKFDPIGTFETEIKNTSNSMKMFCLFSEMFLLSIVHIPSNLISVIFEKEIDVLNLMLYILENIEGKCEKEELLKSLVEKSLFLFLQEGENQIKQRVSNRLIEKQWIGFLDGDSDIIKKSYKILDIEV